MESQESISEPIDGALPEGADSASAAAADALPDGLSSTNDGMREMLIAGGPVVAILIAMSVAALGIVFVKLWQFRRMRLGERKEAPVLPLRGRDDRRPAPHRLAVLRVLARSTDHPPVTEIHRRARAEDAAISVATVYRNINMLEAAGVIERRSFQSDSARFEMSAGPAHDHLIDIESGEVLEFRDDAFERMKARIARDLGYRLVECRVELYGRALGDEP